MYLDRSVHQGWFHMERTGRQLHQDRGILYPPLQCVLLAANLFTLSTTGISADPPYPSSSIIAGVAFDWATHQQLAPGSDNWAITWADDNNQYATWGDGGGFGGTNEDGRVSLGVACVQGDWKNFTIHNVWGGKGAENPAQFEGKSYGIISVDGILYMWVSPGSETGNYEEARLASSTDHGATWSRLSWAFTKAEAIILPTFCQFGKDYQGARDNYLYVYAIRLQNEQDLMVQIPGQIDLMRAPRNGLKDRSLYEFFAGLDTRGDPSWTGNPTDRVPVFQDVNGVGWTVSVSSIQGLGRYILATEHTQSFSGNFGFFDAPEPWGPWTTVAYNSSSAGFGTAFFWNFSNKWMSTNGLDFTLLFTGTGKYDSWNSIRGRFIPQTPPNSGMP